MVADDPTLLVAVIATAGVTFHYTGQPTLALQAYQEAFPALDQASPLAQGSLYMKQARLTHNSVCGAKRNSISIARTGSFLRIPLKIRLFSTRTAARHRCAYGMD